MKNYIYTENWFFSNDLERYLPINTKNEIHILEIGSFEGRSTIWFIENLLNNENSTITCIDPWLNYSQNEDSINSYFKEDNEWCFRDNKIKQTFLHNIVESGKANQVNIIQGFSHLILPSLILNKNKYDIIFIDGNHTSPFVLMDSVMSWPLLNINGKIIFDDYLWELNRKETLRPKLAIDSFISNFEDYIEVCCDEYRKIIKKTK